MMKAKSQLRLDPIWSLYQKFTCDSHVCHVVSLVLYISSHTS